MKVILLAAISVDGFIAQTAMQKSTDWNSPEDRKFFRERSKQAGTLIMGSTTFFTFAKPMPSRQILVYTTKPEKLATFNPAEVRAVTQEPAALLKELEAQGLKEVAITGGAHIYHQFLKANLVDEVILTIEPVLFGSGVKLLSDELELKLQLMSSEKVNDRGTTIVKYKVIAT